MTVDELDILPREAAVLMVWFRRRGFKVHIFGSKHRPDAMVLSRARGPYVDIAHVRGSHKTYAARLPEYSDNIFAPLWVYDHKYGDVVETFEYLRGLVQSDVDYTTREPYEPPVEESTNRIPLVISREMLDGKTSVLAPLGDL